MRTPISYYGGKVGMLNHILPNIPKHHLYCEPFFGGGAVFWAKPKSQLEVINDKNGWAVAFYRTIKKDFGILRHLIQATPNSRKVHREAEFVLKHSDHFSEIKVAWAFWVQTNMSFTSTIFGGYGYDKLKGSCVKKIDNKKLQFGTHLQKRLDRVDIECNDAIKVITSRDKADAFHYVDPPYFNSHCGHYAGYTLQDFEKLLTALSNIKGKFLLSSYDSEALASYTKMKGWDTLRIEKVITACKGDRSKTKVEVLTANYQLKGF